jgi:hypothetical protein
METEPIEWHWQVVEHRSEPAILEEDTFKVALCNSDLVSIG